ncbi:hypothetical protein JW905_04405 [bacterium]|nr:hypothetical protein [candidate division CSSED10-310 bacterium]
MYFIDDSWFEVQQLYSIQCREGGQGSYRDVPALGSGAMPLARGGRCGLPLVVGGVIEEYADY